MSILIKVDKGRKRSVSVREKCATKWAYRRKIIMKVDFCSDFCVCENSAGTPSVNH